MHLMTSLLILIVVARLLGQLFKRINQPSIVGEMLAGVLLGPSVFAFIEPNAALSGIAELAIFLVVLSAGLEMNFKDVTSAMRGKGAIIAFLGFAIPFTAGTLLGLAFDLDIMRTVFLGLCVSITALPVAIGILQSFKLLSSDIGRYSVATAVVNDVVALLVLGVILNLPEQRSLQAVAIAVFSISWKLVALIALIVGFNWFLQREVKAGVHIQRLSEKIVSLLGSEALFGILILFVLVFGSISEILGFHFIIGAFFGSLLVDKSFFIPTRFEDLEKTLASISGGFLAPVFFAYLGLEFNLISIPSVSFILAIILVSIASKVFAGWLGGRIIGMPNPRALGLGIILNGRGIMELVIAGIAYDRGFIGQGLFSALILMGVVTTMITPIMFKKWALPKLAESQPA